MLIQPSPNAADQGVTALADNVAADPQAAFERAQVAARWHSVRARYNALPEHIRRVIRLTLERSGAARDTESLSAIIQRVAAEHGAAPSDFAHLSPSERLALTADLNDQARQGSPWTRCSLAFSPLASNWREASPQRCKQLAQAIAGYDSFESATDPAGDRSSGIVSVGGVSFRFQILYRRPTSSLECPTPWNADLSRRVLFVSIAGEFAFYNEQETA